MKGYWIILGTTVTNTQAQQEYGRLWAPSAEHYGARLKALDSTALAVEFDSYAQAQACYADPAYSEAKAMALRAYRRELLIVEGDIG